MVENTNRDEDVVLTEEEYTKADYPELNEYQINELNEGRLPGLLKLQTITLVTSLLALVFSIVALIF